MEPGWPRQSVTSLRFIHSRGSTSPSTASSPLSTASLTVFSATDLESQTSSYPCSSCFAPPSLLHKVTEAAERGGCRVARYPASWPSYSGTQLAAPLPFHPIGWPQLLSGSNDILSVAIGAIGKQRPKMRFPVSFSLLTNK